MVPKNVVHVVSADLASRNTILLILGCKYPDQHKFQDKVAEAHRALKLDGLERFSGIEVAGKHAECVEHGRRENSREPNKRCRVGHIAHGGNLA